MDQWTRYTAWAVVVIAAFMLVSCASTSGREGTGGFIDDSTITTKVKSSFLADPMVSSLSISVETTQGVVHLKGIVDSEQERQRAI